VRRAALRLCQAALAPLALAAACRWAAAAACLAPVARLKSLPLMLTPSLVTYLCAQVAQVQLLQDPICLLLGVLKMGKAGVMRLLLVLEVR
jgi:hypothetical protein